MRYYKCYQTINTNDCYIAKDEYVGVKNFPQFGSIPVLHYGKVKGIANFSFGSHFVKVNEEDVPPAKLKFIIADLKQCYGEQ